ncbi:MAG: ubiquinone/menaquinone biosynthesis methyltransferase [Opitutales bacterium]|nr:ubiquinone/menaquinone biosynthesis methyltransferase [Opitutales bacterium]
MPEAAKVRGIFSSIAKRYDLANRVISCGQDTRWRRDVVRMLKARNPAVVVDLATGSGDLAFELRRALPESVSITGLDFCEPMLNEARAKQAGRSWAASIKFVRGDCMALDMPDESVDALTIAWGLRNFENREQGLKEMLRVLKPGGVLYCLEASQPYRWVRWPYYLYLNYGVPFMAWLLTGRKGAYDYLASSIGSFPGRQELGAQMLAAGFSKVRAYPRMFSSIAIHEAIK